MHSFRYMYLLWLARLMLILISVFVFAQHAYHMSPLKDPNSLYFCHCQAYVLKKKHVIIVIKRHVIMLINLRFTLAHKVY
jgi:hypothetical protein